MVSQTMVMCGLLDRTDRDTQQIEMPGVQTP
jgi:hypothetical protein